jgi:PAS domain S-box-containing protein
VRHDAVSYHQSSSNSGFGNLYYAISDRRLTLEHVLFWQNDDEIGNLGSILSWDDEEAAARNALINESNHRSSGDSVADMGQFTILKDGMPDYNYMHQNGAMLPSYANKNTMQQRSTTTNDNNNNGFQRQQQQQGQQMQNAVNSMQAILQQAVAQQQQQQQQNQLQQQNNQQQQQNNQQQFSMPQQLQQQNNQQQQHNQQQQNNQQQQGNQQQQQFTSNQLAQLLAQQAQAVLNQGQQHGQPQQQQQMPQQQQQQAAMESMLQMQQNLQQALQASQKSQQPESVQAPSQQRQQGQLQFNVNDPNSLLQQLQFAQLQQQFQAAQAHANASNASQQLQPSQQAQQMQQAQQQRQQQMTQSSAPTAQQQQNAAVQVQVTHDAQASSQQYKAVSDAMKAQYDQSSSQSPLPDVKDPMDPSNAKKSRSNPTHQRQTSQMKALPDADLASSEMISSSMVVSGASDTEHDLSEMSGAVVLAAAEAAAAAIPSQPPLDTSNMTEEEKNRANRDRNKEHARNTRLRKKAYLEKLKATVDELCRERNTLVSERAGAANILVEMHNTRTEVLMSFFALRSTNEKRRRLWSSILDESCFACVAPVTPYRSFPASEVQVSKCQRTILGIDGIMSDTASLHVLFGSLVDRRRFPLSKIEFRYTLVTEEAVVAGNQMMARWVMSTTNAIQCGAKMEVYKQGMMCCRFNSSHKIVGLELMFDVMAFMLQLKQAAGTGNFSVIPNTVQTCQRTFDKPVLMCTADPPYTIVQVNSLWEEMSGYTADQVVNKASSGILQGANTDSNAVEEMMTELRYKRPAYAMQINYKQSGELFRNFLFVYPLSTDSKITHFLAISEHTDNGVPTCQSPIPNSLTSGMQISQPLASYAIQGASQQHIHENHQQQQHDMISSVVYGGLSMSANTNQGATMSDGRTNNADNDPMATMFPSSPSPSNTVDSTNKRSYDESGTSDED